MGSRAIKLGALVCVFFTVALVAGAAGAVITQKGNLRVKVSGEISPRALPRSVPAPIAVSIGGLVSTTDQSFPPQLRKLVIEINRNGHLDYKGLPVCRLHDIQPATNPTALSACRQALVGQGTFSAYIILKGQEPYPATGRLLLFNGRDGGHQVLLGHIYIAHPFASSFVIPFQIAARPHGTYGTVLTADLARALGTRRYLTGIEMTLQRRFSSHGTSHSFISASCPAPKGISGAVPFSLARTSFSFADGAKLNSILTGTCSARHG
jgi:hypothetical protein